MVKDQWSSGAVEGNVMFSSKCPHCQAEFEAEDDWVGQEAECPNCNTSITIKKPFEDLSPSCKSTKDISQKTDIIHSPTENKSSASNRLVCPSCSAGMLPGAVICIQCGHDRRRWFEKRVKFSHVLMGCGSVLALFVFAILSMAIIDVLRHPEKYARENKPGMQSSQQEVATNPYLSNEPFLICTGDEKDKEILREHLNGLDIWKRYYQFKKEANSPTPYFVIENLSHSGIPEREAFGGILHSLRFSNPGDPDAETITIQTNSEFSLPVKITAEIGVRPHFSLTSRQARASAGRFTMPTQEYITFINQWRADSSHLGVNRPEIIKTIDRYFWEASRRVAVKRFAHELARCVFTLDVDSKEIISEILGPHLFMVSIKTETPKPLDWDTYCLFECYLENIHKLDADEYAKHLGRILNMPNNWERLLFPLRETQSPHFSDCLKAILDFSNSHSPAPPVFAKNSILFLNHCRWLIGDMETPVLMNLVRTSLEDKPTPHTIAMVDIILRELVLTRMGANNAEELTKRINAIEELRKTGNQNVISSVDAFMKWLFLVEQNLKNNTLTRAIDAAGRNRLLEDQPIHR